jgi:predicted DNA-binding transcriptional regulator YafY
VTERFDRILGILLFLRSGHVIPAAELARRFAVSTRTIHRDLKTLQTVGVPVYAERGRDGGFGLAEGYVLPPLMFAPGEAIALLLGLTLLRRLRARPFPAELDTVERKLLTAVPAPTRAVLERVEALIGFEALPDDIFHPECSPHPPVTDPDSGLVIGQENESATISAFLHAILDSTQVRLRYRSPHRGGAEESIVTPLGLLWDRDRWYVASHPDGRPCEARMWRADRVTEISLVRPRLAGRPDPAVRDAFNVRELLGRRWLRHAMDCWRRQAPVAIRLTRAQADRLRRDWYYHHARFEQVNEETVVMTFGEGNRAAVLELLRWLGPGAELLEPVDWRQAMREDLQRMLASYGHERDQS